jgi:hypothetical protein
MTYIKLAAFIFLSGGFAFGLCDRWLASDYYSFTIATICSLPLLVLFPYGE